MTDLPQDSMKRPDKFLCSRRIECTKTSFFFSGLKKIVFLSAVGYVIFLVKRGIPSFLLPRIWNDLSQGLTWKHLFLPPAIFGGEIVDNRDSERLWYKFRRWKRLVQPWRTHIGPIAGAGFYLMLTKYLWREKISSKMVEKMEENYLVSCVRFETNTLAILLASLQGF